MGDVHSLQAARPPVDDELIAKLEETLARAKRGEIHSVAVAELSNDQCLATWWHKPLSGALTSIVGSVDFLKFRIMRDGFEAR